MPHSYRKNEIPPTAEPDIVVSLIEKQIVFEDWLPDMMNDTCRKNRMRRFHVAVAAVHPNDHGLGQSIVSVFCVVNDSHVINPSFLCSAVRYIVIDAGMKKRHTNRVPSFG